MVALNTLILNLKKASLKLISSCAATLKGKGRLDSLTRHRQQTLVQSSQPQKDSSSLFKIAIFWFFTVRQSSSTRRLTVNKNIQAKLTPNNVHVLFSAGNSQ
jgi:hypothetical protein